MKISTRLGLILAGGVLVLTAPAARAEIPSTPNDYAQESNWLCLPGRTDACGGDNTTTVVRADGSTTIETWKADPKAPIDCFYVYPTVSRDPGAVSDMAIGTEERVVVEQQLSRFASKCRVFAPMYRQFTLTALRDVMLGRPSADAMNPAARERGYADVLDAWTWYLKHANQGRGVVLIGHSQGSGVLTQLIAREIDGKPVQKQLISAILMGSNLEVPAGKDVGGAFKAVPLCRSATQTGCAIAYVSFNAANPPPANSRFGKPRVPHEGWVSACVNPANLAGGPGDLRAYLPSGPVMMDGRSTAAWAAGKTITTPFVTLPGLITGRCVSENGFDYLAVQVNADPADPRADEIGGEVVAGGRVLPDWGLHLIDANLAMGNLVDLVEVQGAAWRSASR